MGDFSKKLERKEEINCEKVIEKLRSECSSEVMSEIEKHAEKCKFCDELLRDWFYNEIIGISSEEEMKQKTEEAILAKIINREK